MKLNQKFENLTHRLENVCQSVKEQTYDKLFHEYTTLYPRLVQKPEQRDLLKQMLKLYVHIEYDLWPKIQWLFENDLTKYRAIAGIFLKTMQQWDRELSRLGFTFTSQPYIPREDRKTFDPKAVVQLHNRVKELTETVQEQTEEAKAHEELLKIKQKKKAPPDGS